MATVDVVEARLVANVAAFETGMRQADAAVVGLGQSLNTAQQRMAVGQVALTRTGTVAGETGRHVRRLENTLTGLALSGIGLTGPLGSVASILLNIGTNAKALIGIGAIFSGIAIGIQRANKAAKELADQLERSRQFRQGRLDVIGEAGAEMGPALEARARFLRDQMANLRGGPVAFLGGAVQQELTPAVIEQIRILQAELDAVTAALGRIGAAAQTNLGGLSEQFIDVSDRVERFRIAQTRRTAPQDLATMAGGKPEDIEGTFGVQNQQAILKAMTPSSDANLRLAQAGASAASALFRGFIDGSMKFEDILKNFLLAFVEIAIIGPLFQGLKIFSPSHVSQEAGLQVGAGLMQGLAQSIGGVQRASALLATAASPTIAPVGPFRLDATFSAANLPPPLTPFEAARDAMWQTMFRETALVARSQGFR